MNPSTRPSRFAFSQWRAWGRVVVGLLLLLVLIPKASAVFTFSELTPERSITMQVGSSLFGRINSVKFDVSNASISSNSVLVTGIPSDTANTAATSPAGGMSVHLTAKMPETAQVTLNVDSAAGLSCVAGSGCGMTIIPFNTISWISYNHNATYPTLDIQNGTFNGSSSQILATYSFFNTSVKMSNVLIFQYANTTLYPAGQYSGRVTFTGSMP